jgi:hypothetical protein
MKMDTETMRIKVRQLYRDRYSDVRSITKSAATAARVVVAMNDPTAGKISMIVQTDYVILTN